MVELLQPAKANGMDKPALLAVFRNVQDLDKTESGPLVRRSKSGLKCLQGFAVFRPDMTRARYA